MASTLVLNADYRPHSLISWEEAIVKVLQGKARVVAEYDDWKVRSTTFTLKVPSVVVLVKYIVFRHNVKFSRANIYARDEYTCQFCLQKAGEGGRLSISDLTFDHVVPRSRGGQTSWENIVTACQSCNTRKANRTPKEANMILHRIPVRPMYVGNMEFILSSRSIPDAWRDFLYWNQELESE
jgi:5-methylcytosine-specific restriction endonuclease McrA